MSNPVEYVRCSCLCHNEEEGVIRALYQRQVLPAFHRKVLSAMYDGVDARNPLEAAVACAGCQDAHCLALIERRRWPLVLTRETWKDADRFGG